ncbi:MAG TPA: hypothetical protein VM686_32085 [Polyangiaceae bacterium]|nr:hypothetical protein [Polyangiaceae bacterium]
MSDAKDEIEKAEAPATAEVESPPASEPPASEAPPASESAAEAASPPVSKKKKKKKRKPAESEQSSEEALPEEAAPVLDVSGAERPAFHAWFPRNEELQVLVRAFEVGNYALVRERAPKLAQSGESEKVRAAARELMARIEPDPLMKYLLLAATLLLVFLAFYAYRHAH